MSGTPEGIVYIVDDDEAIRESLSVVLQVKGIPCVTFASPQEFLRESDLSGRCCLVLDERLPGMSGLELLDRIPDRTNLPVFMITGHGDVDLLAAAERKGVRRCFKKPFDVTDLLSGIREAIGP